MTRVLTVTLSVFLSALMALCQEARTNPDGKTATVGRSFTEGSQKTIYLECGSLLDSKSSKLLSRVRIAVSMPDGTITAVQQQKDGIGLGVASGVVEDVDLSRETCLPGLID